MAQFGSGHFNWQRQQKIGNRYQLQSVTKRSKSDYDFLEIGLKVKIKSGRIKHSRRDFFLRRNVALFLCSEAWHFRN